MKNTLVKVSSSVVGTFTTYLVAAKSVFAQVKTPTVPGILQGDGNTLWNLIMNALSWAIGLIALIAVVMLIWSGVQYITAGGDEGKVEKATKGITNAIIGLIICLVAGLIVNFVIGQLTTLAK